MIKETLLKKTDFQRFSGKNESTNSYAKPKLMFLGGNGNIEGGKQNQNREDVYQYTPDTNKPSVIVSLPVGES